MAWLGSLAFAGLVAAGSTAPAPAPQPMPYDRLEQRVGGWTVRDVAVDPRGRTWALASAPRAALLRIDDDARIVEERALVTAGSDERPTLLADGSVSFGWLMAAPDGRPVPKPPWLEHATILAACGDETIVASAKALEARGPDGTPRVRFGRYGFASGRTPRAVACGAGRVVLALDEQLVLHDLATGTFVAAVGSGTDKPLAFQAHYRAVAIDEAGYVYALRGSGPRTLDVFDPRLDPVTSFGVPGERMAVDPRGWIRVVANGGLVTFAPRGQGIHPYAGVPPPPTPDARTPRRFDVAASWQPVAPRAMWLHAGSTRVTSLAWDPADTTKLWMGTPSGLVRHAPATGDWKRFTIADGLEGGVTDLAFDPRGRKLYFAGDHAWRMDVASGRIKRLVPRDPRAWLRAEAIAAASRRRRPAIATTMGLLLGVAPDRFEGVAGLRGRVVVWGSRDWLALADQEVLRVTPGAPRAPIVTDARRVAQLAGHPVALLPQQLVSLSAGAGGRAWLAAARIGVVPIDPAAGAGRPVGPAPPGGFGQGARAVVETRDATFVIGRKDVGRIEGDHVRWIWDAQRAFPETTEPIADAVADPRDPLALWLALSVGAARLDTRTGEVEMHAPPTDGAVAGTRWIGEAGGRMWGARDRGAAEPAGVVARDLAGGPWREVASLPSDARAIGFDRDGALVAVDHADRAWRVDLATITATPFGATERCPGRDAFAVADDGATMASLCSGRSLTLCLSGTGGSRTCREIEQPVGPLHGARDLAGDPSDPQHAFVATWSGLYRMNVATQELSRAAEGSFARLAVVGGGEVWAGGGDGGSLLWDPVRRTGRVVNAREASWPDPLDPARAWVRTDEGLELVDVATRAVIAKRAFGGIPPRAPLRVTRTGDRRTAWFDCCGGLAEVPLDP